MKDKSTVFLIRKRIATNTIIVRSGQQTGFFPPLDTLGGNQGYNYVAMMRRGLAQRHSKYNWAELDLDIKNQNDETLCPFPILPAVDPG